MLAHDEELVREGMITMEQVLIEKQIQAVDMKIIKKWEKLVRMSLSREKLREEYGY